MKIKIGNDEREVEDLIREKVKIRDKFWMPEEWMIILDYGICNNIWCITEKQNKGAYQYYNQTSDLEYYTEPKQETVLEPWLVSYYGDSFFIEFFADESIAKANCERRNSQLLRKVTPEELASGRIKI